MKIYSKKAFAFGVFSTILGLLNLAASVRTGLDAKSIILILFLLFFGAASVIRSLSQKLSREDRLDELDERNQLIELMSKSKAFRLTQWISFGLMLFFLVMGKISGYQGFISIGIGLAFAFSISMFTELFTYFYYEKSH